jgi:hypothetical protein
MARVLTIGVACLILGACVETPSEPGDLLLPASRWIGDGACLSVADGGCDLVAGCGHGQFPRPVLRGDGTFEVAGTYRIEAGPVSIDPAPPAMFSGVLVGGTLTLTVRPSDPSLKTGSYALRITNSTEKCTVPCV